MSPQTRMREQIGRVRRKMAEKLSEALGTYIDPADLHSAQGHHRTSRLSEATQWEGPMGIASWDSMTDCLRHGFDVERGSVASPTVMGRSVSIAIHAKAKG